MIRPNTFHKLSCSLRPTFPRNTCSRASSTSRSRSPCDKFQSASRTPRLLYKHHRAFYSPHPRSQGNRTRRKTELGILVCKQGSGRCRSCTCGRDHSADCSCIHSLVHTFLYHKCLGTGSHWLRRHTHPRNFQLPSRSPENPKPLIHSERQAKNVNIRYT